MRKVFLVLALVVAAVTTAASAGTTQSDQRGAAFRSDVVRVLTQLKPAAAKLDRTGIAGARTDHTAALDRAIASVSAASPEQLAALQRAFNAYPTWRSLPTKTNKLAGRLPSHGYAPMGTKITPDNCAAARAWGYTQTDVEIAADVALAADAILEAVPSDLLSEVVRIAAVALWAIPQGVLRGFEHSYNIASACDDADHQALVQQNLDVKVSTRSTQTSVDSLTTILQNAVTTISNSFTSVLNSISTLKTEIENSFSAVTTQITNVQNSVNGVQTSVNNVQSSVNTVNSNVISLTTNVAQDAALNLRLHIEEDLATPGNHPVGLFQLPTAQGGHLDLVRTIVLDIINKTISSGQTAGNAQSFLASGDDLRSAGKFKEAYAAYGKAYQAATK